jgi:hypothetical protein
MWNEFVGRGPKRLNPVAGFNRRFESHPARREKLVKLYCNLRQQTPGEE